MSSTEEIENAVMEPRPEKAAAAATSAEPSLLEPITALNAYLYPNKSAEIFHRCRNDARAYLHTLHSLWEKHGNKVLTPETYRAWETTLTDLIETLVKVSSYAEARNYLNVLRGLHIWNKLQSLKSDAQDEKQAKPARSVNNGVFPEIKHYRLMAHCCWRMGDVVGHLRTIKQMTTYLAEKIKYLKNKRTKNDNPEKQVRLKTALTALRGELATWEHEEQTAKHAAESRISEEYTRVMTQNGGSKLYQDEMQAIFQESFSSGFYVPGSPLNLFDYISEIAPNESLANLNVITAFQTYCEVYPDANANGAVSIQSNSKSSLGVFAEKSFAPGEVIGVFKPLFWASVDPESCDNCGRTVHGADPASKDEVKHPTTCQVDSSGKAEAKSGAAVCTARYCSPECRDKAVAGQHKLLCPIDHPRKFDLAKMREEIRLTGQSITSRVVYLVARILADVKTNGSASILHHPMLVHVMHHASSINDARPYKYMEEKYSAICELVSHTKLDPSFDFRLFNLLLDGLLNYTYSIALTEPTTGVPMGAALYYLPSFFNHSCIPNVAWVTLFDEFAKCWTLVARAKDPIEKGEELFISYVDETNLSIMDRKDLLGHYNFDCDCKLCEVQSKLNVNAQTDICKRAIVVYGAELVKKQNERRKQQQQNKEPEVASSSSDSDVTSSEKTVVVADEPLP